MKKYDKAILDQEKAIELCWKLLKIYDHEKNLEYIDDWVDIGSTWNVNFYYDTKESVVKFALYKVVDGNTDTSIDYSKQDSK